MAKKESLKLKVVETCLDIAAGGQFPAFTGVLNVVGGRKETVREGYSEFEQYVLELVKKDLEKKHEDPSLALQLAEARRTIDKLSDQLANAGRESLKQVESIERFLLRQAAESREFAGVEKREISRLKAAVDHRNLEIKRMERQIADYRALVKAHSIDDPYN